MSDLESLSRAWEVLKTSIEGSIVWLHVRKILAHFGARPSNTDGQKWVEDALLEYVQIVHEESGSLVFPGLRRPIALSEILQTARVGSEDHDLDGDESERAVVRAGYGQWSGPDDLQRILDSGSSLEWRELHALADSWLIVGAAGSGKSTLLQDEAHRAAELILSIQRIAFDARIPIRLTARASLDALKERSFTELLEDAVLSTLARGRTYAGHARQRISDRLGRGFLEGRRLLVLLDGLDEKLAAAEQQHLITELQRSWPRHHWQILIASRPEAEGLPTFQRVRAVALRPFNEETDVPGFVRGWFAQAADGAERASALRSQLDDPQLKTLALNPLCLAFLCLTFENGEGTVPRSRADLYSATLRGLMRTWPSKHSRRAELADVKLEVLEQCAWLSMVEPSSLLGANLIARLRADLAGRFELDLEQVAAILDELVRVDGILRLSTKGIDREYGFFHPSVAEYLVARSITADPDRMREVLGEIHLRRWHGVLPFLAGMEAVSKQVLAAIFGSTLVEKARMRLLAECLRECADSVGPELVLDLAARAQDAHDLPWTRLIARPMVSIWLDGHRAGDDVVKNLTDLLALTLEYKLYPNVKSSAGTAAYRDVKATHAIAAMQSPDPLVRWTAAWIVGLLRDMDGFRGLVHFIGDPDPRVRAMVAWSLGVGQERDAIEALRRALQDPDEMVQRTAAFAIGRLRDKTSIPVLLEMSSRWGQAMSRSATWAIDQILKAPGIDVRTLDTIREQMLQWIQNDAPNLPSVLSCIRTLIEGRKVDQERVREQLIGLLKHERPEVRASAAYALNACISPSVSTALRSVLDDSDPRVTASAASGLGQQRDATAVEALCRHVGNEDPRVRRSVLWALSQMADREAVLNELFQAMRALPPLVGSTLLVSLRGWNDPMATKRVVERGLEMLSTRDLVTCAAGLFYFSRKPDPTASPLLRGLLQHEDARVRASACSCIAQLVATQDRAASVEGMDDVIRLLGQDSDPGVQASALLLLREAREEQAVPAVIPLIEHEDPRVRAAACAFFAAIPHRDAVRGCLRRLSDPVATVRSSACAVFERKCNRRAIPLAMRLLQSDPEGAVRASACWVLRSAGYRKAAGAVLALLRHSDARARSSAYGYFNELPDSRAIPGCLKALHDSDRGVRASACAALQKMPSEDAIEPGILLMTEDPDGGVRASACLMVGLADGRMSDEQRSRAERSFRELERDPDPRVKSCAKRARQMLRPSTPVS